MTELIETIVKPLVDYPDEVVVTKSMNEGLVTYSLSVHKNDMGKVIGKHGRTAKSIRSVVNAAGANRNERIHLEIV
ncbi:hypothetical protein DCC39_00900 [Pueribacillus theae]|uniref:RNA-binding protein KhpA n=1 Tax=Pueribacillus theae TaxID=2171751 RepID=A0A2U1K7H1_9BACI|nr:KH domain-containing protein [Pueribacillus theae]PWA13481.1 hypothetical protein DCC39_00900 [Pueribacillus theae]